MIKMNKKGLLVIGILVLSSLVPLFSFAPTAEAGDWWDSDWDNARKITIDHNLINQTLMNFTILVRINSTIGADCNNGDSLRFFNSDNSTQYYHEIENFNPAGESQVWVRVNGTLSASADTILWMYYNNAGASDASSPNDVWDSRYAGVWHMNDSTTSTITDSTSNNNDGTKTRANEPLQSAGVVGYGQYIPEGSDNNITIPYSASLNATEDFTALAWSKTDNTSTNLVMISRDEGDPDRGWNLLNHNGVSRIFGNDGSNGVVDGTQNISNEKWHQSVGQILSNDDYKIYTDGFFEAKATQGAPVTLKHDIITTIAGKSDGTLTFNGTLDEIVLMNVVVNDSWINTSFYNVHPDYDLVTIGAPATYSGAGESDYEASCTGYEYGNWTHSEHTLGGTLDEEWFEENNSIWYVNDSSSWWINNYTHTFNGTDSTHSFAVLNNSGLNRTQRFGWVHANDTETNALWPYMIYAFDNESSFDCVMWSSNEVWTLHWNGTNFTDISTGVTIEGDPSGTATDISDQWVQEGVYLTDSGNYYKLIYNQINGTFYFKWWGPNVMSEPTGWATQFSHTNITHPHCSDGAQGYGVWNPNGRDAQVQFDLSQVWELNYTTNVSNWCNISGMNESRPHMNFPVLDMGEWTEEMLSYFNDTFDGNLTWDNVTRMMKDNITNIMNMESRMMKFKTPSGNLQNDTVYYYSCVIENFTAIDPESMFDEFLHIHVQMCPEYEIELDEYGDMIVAIDVDNNRQWDVNDRLYWAWANDTYDEILFTFNGLGNIILNTAGVNIWQTVSNAPANLHRYGPHLQYAISIPLADLVNETGQPLNTSDIFGLSIITTTSGASTATEIPCVWQNWNETTELTFWDETLHMDEAMDYFFTSIGVEGLGANSTSIGRWGEGQIEGEFEASGEVSYEVNITKTANLTSIAEREWQYINYTIWVNNTGAGTLTNLVVNDTNISCACGNFNGTITEISTGWTNLTNRSCHIEITRTNLPAGASWHIWYIVNVTNCSGVDQATIFNNASVNATELDAYREDGHEIVWGVYTTQILINADLPITDTFQISENVITIIGIFLIIFAILLIIGLLKAQGVF